MYDYRVHLEQDQSVRSMKLPLDSYSTDLSAAMGACVLLESIDEQQAEGGSEVGGGRPAISRSGRALTPNVRDEELEG